MKYYIKKYQEPYEPLNKNYPEEVMKYWWQGDDKKFREAVKNYDNYYGTILPEAEITASKTTPTKTSDWTSEHNVAEDNKKYEQAHQAESQKIASAVSNKMNEVGNIIGTTALIGGMTVPALVASPIAFAGGMFGSYLGAKATDKIVDWSTEGKYNTWSDWLVDKADTKYINHNIAEMLNPGALVGGTVGGIFTKPAASWAYRNGKYAYNTKFKGVAKGGDMSEYVPQTIKNQVESGIQGTKDQLKELGMINLPNSKITYKNTPIYNSFLDNIGNITIGFDSQTLRNPFKFYKAYIGSSKPGLTYNFVGGHEYAHTVHPTKIGLYSEEGIPITSTTVGTPREFPIGERSLVKNNNNKLSVIDEYVTADKQLLEADLFKDIDVPRKNIMKGLPNKSHNQAHLRAPQELDADLYALKNLGYIKDGKISDKGLQFLMERHNLSKEGVLNTITDLNTIGYGNAITGQPINSQYIPKPESINMGFAGAPGKFGIKPSKLTEAERLGIPKGDRNNLSESQQEAIRDLYHYITNGKFRQNFLYDPKVGFYWGSTKPTVNTGGYRQMLTDPKAKTIMYDDNTGFVRIPTETGTLTYFPQYNNTSLSISMPKTEINKAGFGEATATAQGRFGKSVILTPPKIDALSAGVHIEGLSSTVPKKQVHDFYKVLTSSSKPGTYVSGDAAAPPLGEQAIVDYVNGNSTKAVSTILSGETPTLTASSRTGLSPDSYISLLKQGNRPEWSLSFNRKQGFAKWNDTAVNNSEIYNAWKAAKNGTTEQKQAYIKLFNDWVAPYNGAKAYLNDKGVIIHPHPFIVRQKQGGSIHIKEKNKGKFTESARRAGKSVQEHARDTINNPKATKLQKI